MKLGVNLALCLSFLCSSLCYCDNTETLESIRQQTQDIYNSGTGPENATFNTIGKSMVAWGIGLSAAIAILASAIKQSDSPTSSSSSSSNSQ